MGSLQILDTERLNMLFAGDRTMIREICEIASADFPETAAKLRKAVEQGELSEVSQYAHTLKGSIANIGGEQASFKAHTINTAARGQDIETCRELLPGFLDALDEFLSSLRTFAEAPH